MPTNYINGKINLPLHWRCEGAVFCGFNSKPSKKTHVCLLREKLMQHHRVEMTQDLFGFAEITVPFDAKKF